MLLLTLILSQLLLPPWMFLARATVAPILSPLLPYLGCFLLLVSLLTLIVTHAVAIYVGCCLPVAAIAVATWDVPSLFVVLPPSSCHHGCDGRHVGVAVNTDMSPKWQAGPLNFSVANSYYESYQIGPPSAIRTPPPIACRRIPMTSLWPTTFWAAGRRTFSAR